MGDIWGLREDAMGILQETTRWPTGASILLPRLEYLIQIRLIWSGDNLNDLDCVEQKEIV